MENEPQVQGLPVAPRNGRCDLRAALSKRQREILQAASLGDPDKLIAGRLQISARTLEGHWRAIHRKLGSFNRVQAGYLFATLGENTHGNSRA